MYAKLLGPIAIFLDTAHMDADDADALASGLIVASLQIT